jgi:hypothetical protein
MEESKDTPEGRIALPAWEYLRLKQSRGTSVHLLELQKIIAPYVELEIKTVILQKIEQYGTLAEALVLIREIKNLKDRIAASKE